MLMHNQVNQPIYIVGTGPYAKDLYSWMILDGHTNVQLISHDSVNNVPVGSQLLLAFYGMQYRKNFLSETTIERYMWPAFVHSSALVTDLASVSPGVIVGPMSVIGHGAVLEDFCLVGTLSKVGHGTHLGRNTVITPGTIIGGSTSTGSNVFFAQSCSVKDKITICDDVVFAMNSVVKKNISKPGRYYGDRKIPV
jgi:UDP-3-O-[3-hydroxymyristoyl] glucosamine N-acyltransferase